MADCPLTASLSILDDLTNTWVAYSTLDADHAWVQSFETGSDTAETAGEITIYLNGAQNFKPETTFKAKI